MSARLLQRLDMMQGNDGDRSVESTLSFKQTDRLHHAARFGSRIDRRHLITSGIKCPPKLAIARSDLKHTSRQRR